MEQNVLARMLEAQRVMQDESFNADPTQMDIEERINFITWNVNALTAELYEMMDEIGWKPWASSRHINGKPAGKEMIDAWHFFMNIMLALSPNIHRGTDTSLALAEWMEQAYFDKHQVNRDRQAEGYDGVSSKCKACKRDIKEVDPDDPNCPQLEGCAVL